MALAKSLLQVFLYIALGLMVTNIETSSVADYSALLLNIYQQAAKQDRPLIIILDSNTQKDNIPQSVYSQPTNDINRDFRNDEKDKEDAPYPFLYLYKLAQQERSQTRNRKLHDRSNSFRESNDQVKNDDGNNSLNKTSCSFWICRDGSFRDRSSNNNDRSEGSDTNDKTYRSQRSDGVIRSDSNDKNDRSDTNDKKDVNDVSDKNDRRSIRDGSNRSERSDRSDSYYNRNDRSESYYDRNDDRYGENFSNKNDRYYRYNSNRNDRYSDRNVRDRYYRSQNRYDRDRRSNSLNNDNSSKSLPSN